MTTTSAQRDRPALLDSALRDFPWWHEVVLAILLVVMMIVAGILSPRFMSVDTQVVLSAQMWDLAILAIPMTLIIITAGIDLSVGSTMALSAVVLGLSYEAGVPLPIGVLLAILTGTAAGALNGAFVAYLRVHPLIVTLATLSAFRGIAEGVSLARPISGFPDSFQLLGGNVLGIPIAGIVFIIIAIVAGVALGMTTFGRSLYAIGYNETATRLSGIAVARIKLLLYTLAGSAAAVAAVLYVARRNTAKADIGRGLELDVITAVVLGGTSIFGGRGTVVGTLLGVLLIHQTRQFVSWYWHREELIQIVIGMLLIVAVLLHALLTPKTRM